MISNDRIRRQMRAQRASLDQQTLAQNSALLCHHIRHSALYQRARHIAFYLPVRGEIDPTPLLEHAWKPGKKTYLPVLIPYGENRLWFAPYDKHSQLKLNRFSIPEPDVHVRKMRPVRNLDLVITPLLAFDQQGNRLGMGGGYYDRTFSFLFNSREGRNPKLLGVAHSLQGVEKLERAPWDVSLDAVATEQGLLHFSNQR